MPSSTEETKLAMRPVDRIGTETVNSVKDGKELSDYEYQDLLMKYYKEVGIGLTDSSKEAHMLRQHHRRNLVKMLGEKGVKVNFAKRDPNGRSY